MFGFLKKKLKEAASRFSKKADEELAEVSDDELTETQAEQLAQESEQVRATASETPLDAEATDTDAITADTTSNTFTDTDKDVDINVDKGADKDDKISSAELELLATNNEVVADNAADDVLVDAPEKLIEEELTDAVHTLSESPVSPVDASTEANSSTEEELDVAVTPVQTEDSARTSSPESDTKTELQDAPEKLVQEEVQETAAAADELTKNEVKAVAREDLLDSEAKDTTKKKKGFFTKLKERIVKFQLTEESFEELFWDFELALLENGVAVEVIEKIKQDLHDVLTKENVTRRSIEQVMLDTLKSSLNQILDIPSFDVLEKTTEHAPLVICVVGVNGSGKTTSIAKLIRYFQKNKKSLVVAAADTFRAAAIQQLEEHTTKLGVKLIKHDYNADPAAVAYDAIQHAKAKKLDVVIIDTAGRLQSNSNLMDELKKVVRINSPDLNMFVGESITGNDCVEQAVAFNEAVGIDGIILSKADIDEKGGAAISVSYVTKKPILFLGVGQEYDDLVPFDKEKVLESLGL